MQEVAEAGIRVQGVFPGAVRTEFWDGSGIEVTAFPDEWVMTAEDAVDAALAGLEAGEAMTFLSLPNRFLQEPGACPPRPTSWPGASRPHGEW